MSFPELLVLRHGETEWNLAERLQGGLDSPLTETGHAQARRQNEILHAFDPVGWDWFSSPQGRAMATAEIAAQGRDVPIIPEPRLREIGMGDWSGAVRSDLVAEFPHLFETDGLGWYDHAPGGEGLLALEQRVAAFLSTLTRPSVLVTHGITSRMIRSLAQGLPGEAFETVGGGQGVVYHLRDGKSRLLT